jgi:hypothetical protein
MEKSTKTFSVLFYFSFSDVTFLGVKLGDDLGTKSFSVVAKKEWTEKRIGTTVIKE